MRARLCCQSSGPAPLVVCKALCKLGLPLSCQRRDVIPRGGQALWLLIPCTCSASSQKCVQIPALTGAICSMRCHARAQHLLGCMGVSACRASQQHAGYSEQSAPLAGRQPSRAPSVLLAIMPMVRSCTRALSCQAGGMHGMQQQTMLQAGLCTEGAAHNSCSTGAADLLATAREA